MGNVPVIRAAGRTWWAAACRSVWPNWMAKWWDTRHTQEKLTPRGHHDWPYKATTRPGGFLPKPRRLTKSTDSIPSRPSTGMHINLILIS